MNSMLNYCITVYNYLPQLGSNVSEVRFAPSTIIYYLANIPSCRKENRHNYILGLLHSQAVSIVQYQCWNLRYIDCSNNVFRLPAAICINKHNIKPVYLCLCVCHITIKSMEFHTFSRVAHLCYDDPDDTKYISYFML